MLFCSFVLIIYVVGLLQSTSSGFHSAGICDYHLYVLIKSKNRNIHIEVKLLDGNSDKIALVYQTAEFELRNQRISLIKIYRIYDKHVNP